MARSPPTTPTNDRARPRRSFRRPQRRSPPLLIQLRLHRSQALPRAGSAEPPDSPPIGSPVEHPTDRRAGRRFAAPRAGRNLVRTGGGCAVHHFFAAMCGRSNRPTAAFASVVMAAGYAAGDPSNSGRPECRSSAAMKASASEILRSGQALFAAASPSARRTRSRFAARLSSASRCILRIRSRARSSIRRFIFFLLRMGPAVVGRIDMLQDRRFRRAITGEVMPRPCGAARGDACGR